MGRSPNSSEVGYNQFGYNGFGYRMTGDAIVMDCSATKAFGDLRQEAQDAFAARFGRPPAWIVAAPGRVNIIGEHTDYNDGFVLPMAIERYLVIAAARRRSTASGQSEPTIRVHSAALDETHAFTISEGRVQRTLDWTSYVRGVFAGYLRNEFRFGSLDLSVSSNVPLGGGLSSSAALEVATATLLETVANRRLDPLDKILLCQKAEHEYAGLPCGIMDQFSSVMGQADQLMLLDCRSLQVEMVPLSDPDVTILIINTNVKRELREGEYAKRRSQCERAAERLGIATLRDVTAEQLEQAADSMDPALRRRARHVISEIQRTVDAADALREQNWDRAGQLMYASHESLRDDYDVSCSELDLLVGLAREIGTAGGVFGARMTGGGFGGCTVSLVRSDAAPAAASSIADRYRQKTGIEATVFASRPAKGAHVVQMG